jgi:hypothetical protein
MSSEMPFDKLLTVHHLAREVGVDYHSLPVGTSSVSSS